MPAQPSGTVQNCRTAETDKEKAEKAGTEQRTARPGCKTGSNAGKERQVMADLGETMKKVLLAGIGAAAETTEKAEQLLNDMVKKGELTIEQGKVLNKELRHNIDEKLKSSKEKAYAQQNRKPDVSEFLKSLSDDDLRELKNRLAAIELDDDDTLVDDSID